MKFSLAMGVAFVLTSGLGEMPAGETKRAALPIDLPTALRLGGAQNPEVKIAREKLAEAQANQDSALTRFSRGFHRASPIAGMTTKFRTFKATLLTFTNTRMPQARRWACNWI